MALRDIQTRYPHPQGRPTSYDEEVIPKVYEYLSTTGREQTELPTLEGLAIYIGVNTDTIQQWKKTYPLFSEATKDIFDRQKNQLMNDGLYGGKEVNSTMAIFLLKANHNMIETQHTDITTNGEKLESRIIIDTHDPAHNSTE